MNDEKEMTARNTSVGADDGRSLTKCTDNSITDEAEEIKGFEEIQRELHLRKYSGNYDNYMTRRTSKQYL